MTGQKWADRLMLICLLTLQFTLSSLPFCPRSSCLFAIFDHFVLHLFPKIMQPSRYPEMLFFLCSLLAGHLRSLCWTTAGLEFLHTPLPSTCAKANAPYLRSKVGPTVVS